MSIMAVISTHDAKQGLGKSNVIYPYPATLKRLKEIIFTIREFCQKIKVPLSLAYL